MWILMLSSIIWPDYFLTPALLYTGSFLIVWSLVVFNTRALKGIFGRQVYSSKVKGTLVGNDAILFGLFALMGSLVAICTGSMMFWAGIARF